MKTPAQFHAALVVQRTTLEAKFQALLDAGDTLRAGDLLAELEFKSRQVNEAAIAAVKGIRL